MTQKRPCGGCTACCTIFTVVELSKARHTPCQHLCAGGCAIHDQPRPAVCTDFYCEWAEEGDWSDDLRPDKCGIIYVSQARIDPHHKLIGGLMANPYAHHGRVNRKQIERLIRAGHVLLMVYENEEESEDHVFYDGTRYPADMVDSVLRSLKVLKQKSVTKLKSFYENRSTTGGKHE